VPACGHAPLRRKDRAWGCGGLRTRYDICRRADGGQVAMGTAEFAELHGTRIDPYADA
jgi:hypothetical protein